MAQKKAWDLAPGPYERVGEAKESGLTMRALELWGEPEGEMRRNNACENSQEMEWKGSLSS